MNTLTKDFVVTMDQTASVIGSGGLDVLSTPSLIAWMENVSYNLCETLNDDSETTVGVKIDMNHTAATLIGKTVTIESRLTETNNKRYTLEVKAFVDGLEIGTAVHHRVKVNSESFIKNIQ